MRTLTRVVALSLLAATISAPAWAGMTIQGKPKVGFLMPGNVMNVEGETQNVTLADDGETLTFTVPMASVSTGIGLRDSHMRDNFVHADQYPDVVLSIAKTAVTWPAASGESAKGQATASFTAHGVTLDVPVAYEIKRTKDSWKVVASFPFDVVKHGITADLSYMGVSFEQVVTGKITTELADAP